MYLISPEVPHENIVSEFNAKGGSEDMLKPTIRN
jgi:hypothetical protein